MFRITKLGSGLYFAALSLALIGLALTSGGVSVEAFRNVITGPVVDALDEL